MRKNRILAVLLAAMLLLATMPSALAARVAPTGEVLTPGEATCADGLKLDKTASRLSGQSTTINLTVSAPSNKGPVAVEFVLDGTSSLHALTTQDDVNALGKAVQSLFAKNEAIYVGVTVFGRSAQIVQPMAPLETLSSDHTDLVSDTVAWLMEDDSLGTNVQAGIQAGLADLAAVNTVIPASESRAVTKYMVLVTDGGSYWWMNDGAEAGNTYNSGILLQNADAADGGYESFLPLSELLKKEISSAPKDYTSAATEPLNDVAEQIKASDTDYTNFETGVYFAAKELENVEKAGVSLITLSRPYYAGKDGLKALTKLAGEFIAKADAQSEGRCAVMDDGDSMVKILSGLSDELLVAVPAGSRIVDFMGKTHSYETESYDFDLVTSKPVTLSITHANGAADTYDGTLENGKLVFGDGSVLVYTSGEEESLTLTLAKDLLVGEKLNLSFTEKLSKRSAAPGFHFLLTNYAAYLDTNPADDLAVAFPDPSVAYYVSAGGEVIPDEPVPGGDDPELDTVNHYAYIIGRKDGLVHPEAQITRGEVATIYFRMLTDASRDKLWSQSNPYSDMTPDLWCNAAVSTMTKAGVINGFMDGTFRPYASITRAQFAAIAVRFFNVTYSGPDKFSDISGHWASDYINRAAAAGIIDGYNDGTFHPNDYITRAAAMKIFNKVLGRAPEKDHLLPAMITWPDNLDAGAWYYANMQEATNSHEYKMATAEDGTSYEVWTKILPVRDWAAFETAWSNSHSADNPGEVISTINLD